MAARADERVMLSERVAPGMLPRVLNSLDMTIIFVAIVLFIVNASAIQRAGPAAFTYWILGFLAFLIPGALITAQLGLMFPQEGSLYVWTQKALGPYWLFQAAVTVIWCLSMVFLFADIFLVKRAFPAKFEEVRVSHPYLLYASGIVGMLASAFGAYVTFRSPWTSLFTIHNWRVWLAVMC